MAITLDSLKNATLNDIKTNSNLSRAFGTLFYGDQTTADNLIRFWQNGVRDFDTDKNYLIDGILGATMFNDLSNYLNRWNAWKNSSDPQDQAIANTQKEVALQELSKKRNLMVNAGIDPASVPLYQFMVTAFGAPSKTTATTKEEAQGINSGDLVRATGDSKIYFITADGQKAWIDNPSKLESMYGTDAWRRVKEVNPNQIATIPTNDIFFNPENVNNTNPFFNGDTGLVQFTDITTPGQPAINSIYLADTKDKTLRPFTSAEAFNNYWQGKLTIDDALNKGKVFKTSTASLANPVNPLSTFKLMNSTNAIKSDGNYTGSELKVDMGAVGSNYGQTQVNQSVVDSAKKILDTVFGWVAETPAAGISQDLLNSVKNDPNLVSFYLNAFLYGNYQLPDILRDLKRRQLIKDGRTDLINTVVIDPTKTADQYYTTTTGQAVRNSNVLTLPDFIADKDMNMFNLPLFKLPDEVFKILVPPLDWNSPEGQSEIEKIKAAYYDVTIQQLEATTERQKAIADQQYKELVATLDRNYNIQLSNNATTAWNQLNSLGKTMVEAGISGSGIEAEAVNDYLRTLRRTDQQAREAHLTEEEQDKASYYKTSATPEEISKLSEEEKQKYGLKPSAEQIAFFSEENLKKQFPGLSDEDLKNYKNSIIDEYGNYRSNLYQTLFTNKMNTEIAKRTYQQEQAQKIKDAEDQRAREDLAATAAARLKQQEADDAATGVKTTTPPASSLTPPAGGTQTPPAPVYNYIRKTGTNEVYNMNTGEHISYDEAVKNNIWNQIQDVDILPSNIKVSTPLAQQAPVSQVPKVTSTSYTAGNAPGVSGPQMPAVKSNLSYTTGSTPTSTVATPKSTSFPKLTLTPGGTLGITSTPMTTAAKSGGLFVNPAEQGTGVLSSLWGKVKSKLKR